ncbi:54 kDa 2'-5'-oligoadenylate synthase-like protein 2 [Fukomys damarensis]|uniref:54 kDa 2'-5'-oligoadenylate synthase-like protein 2 n=3 Tax=Fukomys damarensis TaxID=885580 RepID=A0A091D0S7_FUKDA|nr:54 kDa 2'-5'-oligoadenylate synthase-like protein 2 [Fukomys damarensis]
MNLSPDLYATPGDRLDAFLEHSLQPQGDWKEDAQDAWQRVERFFRDLCFRDQLVLDQEVKVLKVVKVRSRKSSDVIHMDVLLAFDALGSLCLNCKPAPQIYEDLVNSCSHPGEFSASFTVLQRDFVKMRPIKLKNLLRLVKFWYLKYVKPQYQKVALPPKYALELLTVYAWEMGTDQKENFNMDEGLAAVMTLLRDYEDICIYWTKYYDFQSETVRNFIKQRLKKSRPIILDPADPTNNLARGRRWDLMAKEAAYCLQQACCWTEDPSGRWHVQRARDVQATVKQTGKEDWTLSVDPYSPIRKMKAEIKIRNDICGYQRLSFQEPGGQRKLLSSQKTLAYYGIFSKVNIRVLETSLDEIQVFVKDSSGQSRPYAINPDDTILDLKEVIEEAGGPCVEDQTLKFQGRNLRNNHCLEDLEIKDCDTVLLFRRS